MVNPNKSAEDQLADEINIPTPGILFQVVDSLREFVAAGLLRETGKGTCTLADIVPGKSWIDDLIVVELVTKRGTLYHLSVDTYHGGGSFKKSKQRSFFSRLLGLR